MPSAIARKYHGPKLLGDVGKHQLWNTIVDGAARESLCIKPMRMEWDIHLSVVEIKTGASTKRVDIPTSYNSYNGSKLTDEKLHSPLSDTTTAKYNPMDPKHPTRNGSLHRTVVESSTKRKSDSLEAGDSTDAHNAKRLKTAPETAVPRSLESASKTHPLPPEDIPEVQFAGYNAEMLCAPTIIRQHTIGMLNEGQCQGFFLRAATNAISQTNTCTFGGLITRARSGQRP